MRSRKYSSLRRRFSGRSRTRFVARCIRVLIGLGLLGVVTMSMKGVPISQAYSDYQRSKSHSARVLHRTELPLSVGVTHFGEIVELKGRTAPSAIVMINGKEVPSVLEDGSFTFFAKIYDQDAPISIVAQDREGASATLFIRPSMN
jgi:hypothetical protein